jgi:hypothetical protein
MKTFSICLTVLFFILTIMSVYEFFEIPKDWASPLIPEEMVKGMQRAYLAYSIINFVYFLPSLYVTIKRDRLAKAKILVTIILLYIFTIMITSFIGV